MKKLFNVGLALAAILAFAAVSPVQAACTLDTQVLFHGLGSYFTNCADATAVGGYAYLLSAPAATNSGAQDIVCENATQLNQGFPCQPEAGIDGDGIVTITYDWGAGNAGSVGCPNPAGAGNGTTPIGMTVVDSKGNGVLMTMTFNEALGGFMVEQAQQITPDGNSGIPVACAYNGPSLTTAASTTQACVNVPVPTLYSDCDTGSVGEAIGLCAASGATRPTVDRGKLYVRQAACGTAPDTRIAGWTLLGTQPDATGAACNTFNAAATGLCNFIGSTGIVGGTETPNVLGWFQVNAPGAATDKVKIDSAAFAQGKLVVAFSTQDESTIVGFNVYAGSTKLNTGLIAAKGTGSNAYSFETGRGAVKNNKSVTVEAVTSTGGVIKSAPASVK